MASPLTALSLTPAAREWLSHTTSARVLNVFDRACNLINQEEAILALVTSERGLTPFAMVVAPAARTPFRAVSETSAVRVESNRLRVGDLQIEFGAASVWNPTPDWPAVRRLFADQAGLIEALTAAAIEAAPAGSLLELFSRAEARTTNALMLERTREGAVMLGNGLRGGAVEGCVAGAKRLAGLGGGLTPAGDDFIVGVLLAVWAGLYGDGREQLGVAIAGAAAPSTTALSAAYLRSRSEERRVGKECRL